MSRPEPEQGHDYYARLRAAAQSPSPSGTEAFPGWEHTDDTDAPPLGRAPRRGVVVWVLLALLLILALLALAYRPAHRHGVRLPKSEEPIIQAVGRYWPGLPPDGENGRTEPSPAAQPAPAPEPRAPVEPGPPPTPTPAVVLGGGAATGRGIPEVAYHAYVNAADVLARDLPGCGLHWSLLAAIGQVESNHGRFGGGQLRPDGTATVQVLGPALDGRPGFALLTNADGSYVRAIGPMQFLPSSWAAVASDGNGDDVTDPFNIFDATVGAGRYLCAYGTDLTSSAGLKSAVFRYNHSDEYVATVLALATAYATGTSPVLPSPPADDLPPADTTPAPEPPATTPETTTPPVTTLPETTTPETTTPPSTTTPTDTTTPDTTTPPETTTPETTTPDTTVPDTTTPPETTTTPTVTESSTDTTEPSAPPETAATTPSTVDQP